MVIDFKSNWQEANDLIYKDCIGDFCLNEDVDCRSITFRNFPNLHIEGNVVADCVFEHCGLIVLCSCDVEDCTFDDIKEIEGNDTGFTKCDIKNCHAEETLLFLGGGEITACNFTNNSAKGYGYIIDCSFSKKSDVSYITDCCFEKCTVENEENELTCCSYFLPSLPLSTRTKSINNFDYNTCVIKDCNTSSPVEHKDIKEDVPKDNGYRRIEITFND